MKNELGSICDVLYLDGVDGRLVDLLQMPFNPSQSQATDLSIFCHIQASWIISQRPLGEKDKLEEEEEQQQKKRIKNKSCRKLSPIIPP